MTSYQQKQLELLQKLEEEFKKGKTPSTIVELVEDYVNDNRICLTSVVFIPGDLAQLITSKIIDPLRKADPDQYYYPASSLHLTIQNIRTINDPVLFTEDDVKNAKKVFSEVIPRHRSFNFNLQGLFEMPTSLGIRAFSDEALKFLILDLRSKLNQYGIPDNKTYASRDIFFGNISVCRYTQTPKESFFNLVQQLKEVEVGQLRVKTISLVTTNSVCHPEKTKVLQTFSLR